MADQAVDDAQTQVPRVVSPERKCTFWAERCDVVNAPDVPDADKCRWWIKVKGQQMSPLGPAKEVEFDICEFDAILLAAQRPTIIQSPQGGSPQMSGIPPSMKLRR